MTCACFFGGCAHRCLTHHIVLTLVWCGCARRWLTWHIACMMSFGCCARRCWLLLLACTCFLHGRDRRYSIRLITCTCFFHGCAGTLSVFSELFCPFRYYRPLLLHAAALPSRSLPQRLNTFSTQPPVLCLRIYLGLFLSQHRFPTSSTTDRSFFTLVSSDSFPSSKTGRFLFCTSSSLGRSSPTHQCLRIETLKKRNETLKKVWGRVSKTNRHCFPEFMQVTK